MSIDSFRFAGAAAEVQAQIAAGRIPESQRMAWEQKLLRDPRAIRELHLERNIEPKPEPEPEAHLPRSGGEKLEAWLNEQPDLGQATGPAPSRPKFSSPTTTASGIPVEAVRRLPWMVQNYVAGLADPAEAHAAVQRFSDPDTGELEAEIASQSGPAREDVLAYSESVERWRENPAVPLREARRDAGLNPSTGTPVEPHLAQSIRDFEQANSLLTELDNEIRTHNPSYRTSIRINRGI